MSGVNLASFTEIDVMSHREKLDLTLFFSASVAYVEEKNEYSIT